MKEGPIYTSFALLDLFYAASRLETLAVDDGRSRLVVLADKLALVSDAFVRTHDLAIHICWKVESEARMEPPIQTEYSEY